LTFLQTMFSSGAVVDIVLAFMVVEFMWLVARRNRPPADVLIALLPGAMMMLALRAALIGADWMWIALWLALSLPAHLEDVRRRGR